MQRVSLAIDSTALFLDDDAVLVCRRLAWHRVGTLGDVGTRNLGQVRFRAFPQFCRGTRSPDMTTMIATKIVAAPVAERVSRVLQPLVAFIVGRLQVGISIQCCHVLGVVFLRRRVVAE